MKIQKISLFIIFGICIMPGFALGQNGKDKRSPFVKTVDLLLVQIDEQIEDRDNLIVKLKELSNNIKAISQDVLDERIEIARIAVSERESFRLTEELINDPNKFIVRTRLMDFLHRVTENDQALYDDYIEQKAANRFQLEKQLSKIRTEQTQLAAIRRDLEKVKFYPLKKERAKFFLSTATHVLDGFRKVKDL